MSSERRAVAWVERCGGKVERRPEGHYRGPGVTVTLPGYQFGAAGMPRTPVTDDRLALLAELGGVDRLELQCTDLLTAAGFRTLAGLAGLKYLDVSGMRVTTGMLRELAAAPALEELGLRCELEPGALRELAAKPLRLLDLQKSGLTNEALAGVEELTRLGFLMLHGNHDLTDAILPRVGRMTGLEMLDLSSTRVTDGGLAELAGLSRLKSLSLSLCRRVTGTGLRALHGPLEQLSLMLSGITDDGLAAVAGFGGLKWLDFNLTRVTDTGLKHLHGLGRLETLHAGDCHVSAAAVEDLRRALPGCKVTALFSPDWERHWDTFWGPDSPADDETDGDR